MVWSYLEPDILECEVKWALGNISTNKASVGIGIPAAAAAAKSLQLCPTLCDPIDSSPPGSTDHGIIQARELEWVAIAFSILTLGTFFSSMQQKKNIYLFIFFFKKNI